jgi:uncharacterized protein (TIGR02265 family)
MEAYVGALPGGLDAHPACQQKGSIVKGVLQDYPTTRLPRLPDPVQALVDEPPLASVWVSEVHATALYMAICDAHFEDDDAFVAFSGTFNRKLLRSPLYRVLMLVATPARLAHRAGMRWGALHRGSTFEIEMLAEGDARARLRYPTELFPHLMLRCFATGFQAAIEGSGGKNVRLEMGQRTPDDAEYGIHWE